MKTKTYDLIDLCWFAEMTSYNTGSIHDCLTNKVDYDKKAVVEYLNSGKRIGSCGKTTIDCVTGTEIARYFNIYTDGVYDWCGYLPYHIRKYNIKLPQEFLRRIPNAIPK